MKIAHLVTGLETGGAELMMLNLIRQLNTHAVENIVISMTSLGTIAPEINSLGIPVLTLNMTRGKIQLKALRKLLKILDENKPDILQTWLYHSDFLGGLTRLSGSKVPVIWGIHHSTDALHLLKPATRMVVHFNRLLSLVAPQYIVCCSETVYKNYLRIGYPVSKMKLITNGVDVDYYRPNPSIHTFLRKLLGLPKNTLLIGHSGRFTPEKAQDIFLHAAGLIAQTYPDIHFVMAGNRIDQQNPILQDWIEESKLGKRVHLLGQIPNLIQFLPGLDIFVSSSLSEALPLTILEAMSCQVPCVVTNVGDQGILVGETGKIVAAGDARALAEGCISLVDLSADQRLGLGIAARLKVKQSYTIEKSTSEYIALYESTSKKFVSE
jgi:glycosyltransferase involved in cell wall biosynthesis